MSKQVEIVNKISIKKICGRPHPPKDDKPVYLMEIFGIATGVKTGTSNYGDWTAFTGTFQALNIETRKIYRSGKLFVPQIIENLILPALENSDSVEFAFRIGIRKDETSATGYTYIADPMLPVAENDPIELLSRKLSALPSPDKVKEKKTV